MQQDGSDQGIVVLLPLRDEPTKADIAHLRKTHWAKCERLFFESNPKVPIVRCFLQEKDRGHGWPPNSFSLSDEK